MKKIISLVLSIAVLLCSFSVVAYALSTSGTCGDSATWSYSNATLTISGTGKMKDYTQYDPTPGMYTWDEPYEYSYPWKDLDRSITNVVIEEGITYIGSYAFADLPNLEKIELSSTVKGIGKTAFYRNKKLTIVDAPSMEMWCDIAFSNSYSNPVSFAKNLYINGELVEELVIPSIKEIKPYTFYALSSITTPVVIPDTVEVIKGAAFQGCLKIPSVVFPESLTEIGGFAFSTCRSLKELNLPNGLIEIDMHAFEYCHGLTEVRFPDSVKRILGGAFYECGNLSTVHLGLNISTIESDAFEKFEYGEPITDVYYNGDEDSLSRVKISDWNDQLMEAEWHFLHTHEYSVTVIEKTDSPHRGLRIYNCECGIEYKEGYMLPNKFAFLYYKNGYFYYHCEICDNVDSINKDRINTCWKCYINNDWKKEFWYNETCLDLNNDGVINAKDYAKIRHCINYGY